MNARRRDRLRSRPRVARLLAVCTALLSSLQDAVAPVLRNEGVRRGLLFGLGSSLILGVLILLLVRPSEFSAAETIIVFILALASVVAVLVMDLFD